MKLSQFDYYLPDEQIPLKPRNDRSQDRLLVLNKKTGKIEHKKFIDIVEYFGEGDRFVFNNTKIFPAVLKGKKEKTEADIEVFLLRELIPQNNVWDALVNPARKIRIGNKLYFENDLVAEVIDNTTSRGRTIRFLYNGTSEELKKMLRSMGNVPLPPFIQRDFLEEDLKYADSPFAKVEGSVAAPTAGSHFDKILIKKLELQGVSFSEVTLHAGIGNYSRIEVEDLVKHKPDSEKVIITNKTAADINKTLDNQKRVCAIGTTVVKALETPVTTLDRLDPFDGWTVLLIFPPFRIRIANCMISNFQMPMTPMLMTVCAFGGYKNVMHAYEVAVQEGYQMGPFGDAMLII